MAKIKIDDGYAIMNCPGCKGSHVIPVVNAEYCQGREWGWNGDINNPTFTPSILVNVGGSNKSRPICHSFIRDGKWQFLGDCTHSLAGQTVEMEEIK